MVVAYFHAPQENWIVDRFKQEWDNDNWDMSVLNPHAADVLWICADWCWRQLPIELLKERKVLVTCHHYVPSKFNEQEFRLRDQIVTAYHVPNKHTEAFIRPFTQRPIHVIPYWANQNIWKPSTEPRGALRKKHGLPEAGYLIGSFQRDTEGSDLISPKLEKGPDLFADFAEKAYRSWEQTVEIWGRSCGTNINWHPHVVLAGWRRQYVISRLEKAKIPYSYIELPSQETTNELYQTLDLYPVTARQEGGPQSLIEAGLLGINVISRDVGIASEVLPASAINDDVSLATPAIPNIEHLKLPLGYERYRELIESL